MPVNWRDHIVSTPDVLRGKPRVKGTRIPVGLVLGYLAAGKNIQEIKKEFPDLTGEQVAACLDYARETEVYGHHGASGREPPRNHSTAFGEVESLSSAHDDMEHYSGKLLIAETHRIRSRG